MTLDAFMPYGPAGASGRVRVRQWLEHTGIVAQVHDYAGLGNNRPGQVIRHLPRVVSAEIRTRRLSGARYDRVLISREVTPFSSGGLIERIAKSSSLAVYDFDDALMWSPATRRDRFWSKADNCRRAVQVVDRVIAGSEVLAEWASQHSKDVRLIPTCVEPADYDVKNDFGVRQNPRLLWLGSPSTERYLELIAAPLLELNRLTSARLTVISAGEASLGALEAMVDRMNWRPGVERHLSKYDAAIAPLVDGPWERGKCAYKVLQYGAAGLPTVVSPVGANLPAAQRLGQPVAGTQDEWRDALLEVLTAPASERRRLGSEARAGVHRHYSFTVWASEWLDAVGERVLNRDGPGEIVED